jgi:hypothetical protein
VLAAGDEPRFVHPVIRDALEASQDSGGKDRAHRCAARLLPVGPGGPAIITCLASAGL